MVIVAILSSAGEVSRSELLEAAMLLLGQRHPSLVGRMHFERLKRLKQHAHT